MSPTPTPLLLVPFPDTSHWVQFSGPFDLIRADNQIETIETWWVISFSLLPESISSKESNNDGQGPWAPPASMLTVDNFISI